MREVLKRKGSGKNKMRVKTIKNRNYSKKKLEKGGTVSKEKKRVGKKNDGEGDIVKRLIF